MDETKIQYTLCWKRIGTQKEEELFGLYHCFVVFQLTGAAWHPLASGPLQVEEVSVRLITVGLRLNTVSVRLNTVSVRLMTVSVKLNIATKRENTVM